ncbi:beta-glucosidase [Friedmanniella endophytica]|uniref:Beta-glucosidase n=1 Tax=Microlunatus kandeliicorticis TaxID=1759536 RepID=A0A7W3IT48_9ACTN|nr:glycoside hydrolase family 3 N-terminal domain-containing protein [Microlunatus kandeliicorticis]MBA8794782.1 beta-glucosidase [Microlunatus kandeliicorticis]
MSDGTRVGELLARLTLREKVGQLNQRLYGWNATRRGPAGWELSEEFHAEVERWGGLGALYGLFRSDAWSGRGWADGIRPEERPAVAAMVVEAVRAADRHGIAPLLVEEAPHGHQALGAGLLPTNLAVGSGWSPALVAEASAAVAAGLAADGVHLALVSTLDLARDPRWGRSEECFGETPLPAVRFTRAVVEGMQGPDRSRLRSPDGVGVVLKHFAAQGEGLGGRNAHAAQLGPRDLAELHLPAARAGVEAGALGLMAAYNDIDGLPCCANRRLLTDLLRTEWRFDGLVMADGHAVDRLTEPLGSPVAAAVTALTAGVDLSLWDAAFTRLEEAVEARPELLADVDRACARVLTVKDRLGLLGEPAPLAAAGDRPQRLERITLASRRAAEHGLTLLTDRDGVLPLSPRSGGRWLVVGPRADDVTGLLGDYVPPLQPDEARSVAGALADRLHGTGVVVDVRTGDEPDVEQLAAAAGVVVAVLGGTSHRRYTEQFADNGAAAGPTEADGGEGVDRASLRLPGDQDALVARLRAATGAPLVAVLVMGRAYVLTAVERAADAVLVAWYPGPQGGRAVAAALLGDTQPLGRLPVTLPAADGVAPLHDDDRIGADGVYRDAPQAVLHPLGAGHGYRRVGVTAVETEMSPERVTVRVALEAAEEGRWTGPAETVVLVRARRRGGRTWPRRRELVDFRRVQVEPAGTEVAFRLDPSAVFVDPAEVPPFAEPATTLVITVDDHDHELTLRPPVAD